MEFWTGFEPFYKSPATSAKCGVNCIFFYSYPFKTIASPIIILPRQLFSLDGNLKVSRPLARRPPVAPLSYQDVLVEITRSTSEYLRKTPSDTSEEKQKFVRFQGKVIMLRRFGFPPASAFLSFRRTRLAMSRWCDFCSSFDVSSSSAGC